MYVISPPAVKVSRLLGRYMLHSRGVTSNNCRQTRQQTATYCLGDNLSEIAPQNSPTAMKTTCTPWAIISELQGRQQRSHLTSTSHFLP